MIALNKRKILIAFSILVLFGILLFFIGFFIFLSKKQIPSKTEKIPSQFEERINEEEIKKKILENLTAQEKKEPLSKEEREKLEKILESLSVPKK